MVNPLVLLPLLTAPILNATTNGCYTQNPSRQTQRASTTYTVCTQAINRISTGRHLDTPVVFGRTVKVGQLLPTEFVHRGFLGTCVIKLDMKNGEQDTMTWNDVVVSAGNLRDECVAPPPHLGGESKAGPRQLLNIKMYGVDNRKIHLAAAGSSGGLVQGRSIDA